MEIMLLLGFVILGSVVSLVVLVMSLLLPKKNCPDCGEVLPRNRKPRNVMQALWGGWICPKCDTELNRKAEKIVAR